MENIVAILTSFIFQKRKNKERKNNERKTNVKK